MIEMVSVDEIRPHPKNEYYFDDIQGDGWNDLLQSIRTSGVTNAITIDQRDMIISGHQRVRACKLLGIEEIPAHVIHYTDEELKKQKDIKDLIESNLKQRVPGNSNPVKLGRCFAFLEEYYGVKHGNNQHKRTQNNFASKSQQDIADEAGVTTVTIQNYKRLASAIPEIQELVETGKVSLTTALSILRQLPEEEQRKLASSLIESEDRTSNAKVQELINQIAEKDRKIVELENREPVIKIKEVVPSDYEQIKKNLENYKKESVISQKERKQILAKKHELEKRIEDLENRSDLDLLEKKVKEEAGYFAIRTYKYIQQNGGCVWIFEKIDELSDKDRKNFVDAIYAVDAFIKQMIENLGGYGIE